MTAKTVPKYLTTAQAAKRLKRDVRDVQRWCATGRIPGAVRFGRDWLVPADCARPEKCKPGPRGKVVSG